MDDVTDKLLRDGVKLFVDAMEKLIAGVESQREAVVTGRPPTIESVIPDELEPAIAARVKQRRRGATSRSAIWQKDPTLWGGARDTPELGQPARLADDQRVDARARRRPARVRGRAASTPA